LPDIEPGKKSESSMKYKVISLFTGAMGLDIGLERTGLFETIACVEVEPRFCETIRLNRDAGRVGTANMLIINEDVRTLNPKELLRQLGIEAGDFDLLTGGPPCQAFSVFGKRRGLKDSRGQLIFEFIRFVREMRPRAFLMENVRGLMSMPVDDSKKKGALFQLFQKELNKAGYRTDTFLVNSVNYGAPQIRERVLVIGNRSNVFADFPKPTHSNRPPDKLKPFSTLGDAIHGKPDPDPATMDFSPRKKRYLAMIPPGGNWRSMSVDIQKESMGKSYYLTGGRSAYWRKLTYDYPCPTVVTMPNHAGTCMCHPEGLRPLTVGECSLVQGFPEDWKFAGSPSEKYVQVGNAVPIVLGEVSGKAVANLLRRISQTDRSQATVPLSSASMLPDRVIHLRPHVRTRWWWKNGKVIYGMSYTDSPDSKEDNNKKLTLFMKQPGTPSDGDVT
jgi:DNA (cytosine-5)-methyltransferase 1